MMEFFADLHVHVGRAKGQPIKITASKFLTLENIFSSCVYQKGIDIVGVVDCASPLVLQEIKALIDSGDVVEIKGGGLSYLGKLTVFMGAEVETDEGLGAAHNVAFFPEYRQMVCFSDYLSKHITNINLSTQRARFSAHDLLKKVKDIGGELMPAHVFTPFKSFYGRCYDRISHAFLEDYTLVPSVELGLSSDTFLADTIFELHGKSFLSNSDAHSSGKIAREYNKIKLSSPNFKSLIDALHGEGGNRILGNYGLDPRLGKYHRTQCLECGYIATDPPPILVCPHCNGDKLTIGVMDRITQIRDSSVPVHPKGRPPYFHHIPLEFIPGIGKKIYGRLISHFGNEMTVVHKTTMDDLADVVKPKIAKAIIDGREGLLAVKSGGGGVYGKVISKQ